METITRRCYYCESDPKPAAYEAHTDWDCTPIVLLCIDCADWERRGNSIEWIRTLR